MFSFMFVVQQDLGLQFKQYKVERLLGFFYVQSHCAANVVKLMKEMVILSVLLF